MQLLKKSTVQVEAQQARKKVVDEGMHIAKKVDALRQTFSEVQEQHQKFLNGMEGELKERTKPLIDKIASLESEVRDLEDKRRDLLVPLDKEWKELHSKQEELVKVSGLLDKKKEQVAIKETKLLVVGKELKDRIFKVKTRERELAKSLKDAAEGLYIADDKRVEAFRIRESAEDYSKELNQSSLDREAKVAVREREVEMIKNYTDDREKALNAREILLSDREQTLERELKRRNG